MTTSYETLEIIASHHAEVDRLCTELLELGSRVSADEPADFIRERTRALAWRIRAHLTEESAALMADAGDDRARVRELMDHRCAEGQRIDRALAAVEREAHAPLELVNAVCAIARDARACLDRAALT